MIDLDRQEFDRVRIPAVPDDVFLFGANADKLTTIIDLLHAILKTGIRAENPNPSLIDLSPPLGTAGGTNAGRLPTISVRMRGIYLVTSGPGSDEMAIKSGNATLFRWFSSSGLIAIPFPVILDSGTDYQCVDLTTPSSVAWRTFIFAYPELESTTP